MSAIWFDRKFEFTMPVALYPNVVERLRGTPIRLEELVSRLPAELLLRQDNDNWSILENVGHLGDLEPLWDGRIDDFLAGESRLRPAELTNKITHQAKHNQSALDDLLLRFRTARIGMVSRIDDLTESDAARTALHPRLDQPMRLIDSAFFNAEHDDHHLARITELMREFG